MRRTGSGTPTAGALALVVALLLVSHIHQAKGLAMTLKLAAQTIAPGIGPFVVDEGYAITYACTGQLIPAAVSQVVAVADLVTMGASSAATSSATAAAKETAKTQVRTAAEYVVHIFSETTKQSMVDAAKVQCAEATKAIGREAAKKIGREGLQGVAKAAVIQAAQQQAKKATQAIGQQLAVELAQGMHKQVANELAGLAIKEASKEIGRNLGHELGKGAVKAATTAGVAEASKAVQPSMWAEAFHKIAQNLISGDAVKEATKKAAADTARDASKGFLSSLPHWGKVADVASTPTLKAAKEAAATAAKPGLAAAESTKTAGGYITSIWNRVVNGPSTSSTTLPVASSAPATTAAAESSWVSWMPSWGSLGAVGAPLPGGPVIVYVDPSACTGVISNLKAGWYEGELIVAQEPPLSWCEMTFGGIVAWWMVVVLARMHV